MSPVEIRQVAAGEAGMRLDRWFKVHYPAVPHGHLQKLLRTGQVRVDGTRAKSNTRLDTGQNVRVPPMSAPERTETSSRELTKADMAFVQGLVLHEDSDVIALNKPAGLAVQGGTATARHLDGLLDGLVSGGAERPRLVHRLDKDTSGVLLLARTRSAAAKLGRALKHRDARKIYWALVVGVPKPERGEINLALIKAGPAREERVRVAVAGEQGAQRACTRYALLEVAGRRLAWLALWPVTGRTHQLRAHMAALGHPVVGDGKYGGSDAHPGGDIPRLLHLHAHSIAIPHPSGGTLSVSAPLPEHMETSWRLLGLDAEAAADPFEGYF